MEKSDKNKALSGKEVALMSLQIGVSVSVSTVAFILGGRYADQKFGTHPILTVIGGALGLVVSLYLVWQIVEMVLKAKNK